WNVTIGLVVAAVGPTLVVLGTVAASVSKLAGGVQGFIGIWSKLGGLLGQSGGWFTVAVVAIGPLVAGIIWAYNKVKWIHDGVN
ncbi:phage tail tape measure protein, partial [Enterococcus faecium]